MPVRLGRILLAALALAPSAYLAWNWRTMPQLGVLHDDSVYFVSAKSLAQGNGYRIESLPGQPFQTKYPPLLSILLAPVWQLNPAFPDNLKLAALFAWSMLLPFAVSIYFLFRSFGLRPAEVWLLTVLAVANPWVSMLSTTIMSDLLFLSLFVGSMLLAERALDSGKGKWLALAAGLLAGLAYLARAAALPVVVTAPLVFLYRRQVRRGLLFLSGMLPAVAAWQWWASVHRLSTSDSALAYYTDYMAWQSGTVHPGVLGRVLWNNLDAILRSVGQLVVFDLAVLGNRHFERIVAAAALVGALRMVKRSGRLQYAAAAGGMAAILLGYHYMPDARLCLPLLPLALMGFWTEAKRFAVAIQSAWRGSGVANRAAAVGAAALLAFAGAFLLTTYAVGNGVMLPQRYERCRSDLAARQPAYQWFRVNTLSGATSYTYDDPVFYLYTGRRSLGLTIPFGRIYHDNPEREGDEFARSVPRRAREHGLNYLFLTGSDFYREGAPRARLSLRATLSDAGFHQEYAAGQATVFRSKQ